MQGRSQGDDAGDVAQPGCTPLQVLAILGCLGVVFFCDFIAIRGFSLGLLYVVPVAAATSCLGLRSGCGIAVLSAISRMVSGVSDGVAPTVAGWNAGMLLGVLVTFAMLMNAYLRPRSISMARLIACGLAAGIVSGVVLAAVGSARASAFQRLLATVHAPAPTPSTPMHLAAIPSVRPSTVTLDMLQRHALESLPVCRAVLLGSRDPAGQSCIQPVPAGALTHEMPSEMGDFNGGPGTTIAMLLVPGRQSLTTAMDDYRWHQSRLRQFLSNQQRLNQAAKQAAERFHEAARDIADQMAAADALPSHVQPVEFVDDSTWPGFCFGRLNEAVRDGAVGPAKRWSAELAAATFWLADLHRWLDLLVTNHATALDFQKACPEPFHAVDASGERYDILSTCSSLPAGMLTLHGRANFLEVERQAELLFHKCPKRHAALQDDRYTSDESIAVPPARRKAFAAVADCLSPANRRTLAAAARTPYECSFLINMLFRAEASDSLVHECEALRRFDRLNPRATIEQLMGVLFYRGHSFSGLEWSDRFLPRLVEYAEAIEGGAEVAFRDACRTAHELSTRDGKYGPTLTLRDAIDRGLFDCIRATDLANALFRNSGRSGVGHIRWTAGTSAHAVAAHWGGNGRSRILVVDPMAPAGEGRWPDLYFRGAIWPESLPGRPQPHAVELYVRGLDNYIWAEGYAVRGRNAGILVSHAIPYMKGFDTAGERRAYAGPFPAH